MSILDVNPADIPDLRLLDAGEHLLKVVVCEKHTKKDDPSSESLHVQFDAVNDPDAFPIHVYHGYPKQDDDQKVRNSKLRAIKDFCLAFGVDPDLDFEAAVGSTGWALVGIEDSNPEYEPKNRVRRYVRKA